MDRDHGTIGCHGRDTGFEFQGHCLAVLDRVGKTRQPVLVTRFGKQVTQVVPPPPDPGANRLGAMKDQGEIHGDLIAPVSDVSDWEALK